MACLLQITAAVVGHYVSDNQLKEQSERSALDLLGKTPGISSFHPSLGYVTGFCISASLAPQLSSEESLISSSSSTKQTHHEGSSLYSDHGSSQTSSSSSQPSPTVSRRVDGKSSDQTSSTQLAKEQHTATEEDIAKAFQDCAVCVGSSLTTNRILSCVFS